MVAARVRGGPGVGGIVEPIVSGDQQLTICTIHIGAMPTYSLGIVEAVIHSAAARRGVPPRLDRWSGNIAKMVACLRGAHASCRLLATPSHRPAVERCHRSTN